MAKTRKRSKKLQRKTRKTKRHHNNKNLQTDLKCLVKKKYENPIVSIDEKDGITIIIVKKMMSDSEIANCEADYFDNKHYKY